MTDFLLALGCGILLPATGIVVGWAAHRHLRHCPPCLTCARLDTLTADDPAWGADPATREFPLPAPGPTLPLKVPHLPGRSTLAEPSNGRLARWAKGEAL